MSDMKQYLKDVGAYKDPSEGDLSSSMKKYLSEISSSPETLESKYLEPNVYPVIGAGLKGLDIASKPVQYAISLPVQAIDVAQKVMQNPSNPDLSENINPITHPLDAANMFGSTESLISKFPKMDQPLVPNFKSEQFPKAASVISQITGSQLAAPILDTGITMGAGKALGVTGLSDKFSEAASLNREKSLAMNSRLPREDNINFSNKGIFKKMGDTLSRYGMDGYLTNPDTLRQKLVGDRSSPGVLSDLGVQLGDLKSKISQQVPPIDRYELIDDIIDRISNKKNTGESLVPYSVDTENKMYKDLTKMIKPEEGPATFDKLIKLKQQSQSEVFSMSDAQKQAMELKNPMHKEYLKNLWEIIDDHVNKIAQTNNDAASFVSKNSDYSDLINTKNALDGSKYERLALPSLAQAALTMEFGKQTGIPFMAREARQNAGFYSKKLPAFMGSVEQGISNTMNNPLNNIEKTALPSSANFLNSQFQNITNNQQTDIGRIPQSINPYAAMASSKGIVENLANYQIPRDANKILENPKLAIAKIAQVTNDKNIVGILQEAISNYPEKLDTILPGLVMQFPNVFEPDIYGRVNGKILDPALIQKAYNDVSNSGISNTQKAFLKDGLNRDGTLPKENFK